MIVISKPCYAELWNPKEVIIHPFPIYHRRRKISSKEKPRGIYEREEEEHLVLSSLLVDIGLGL